jgi:hypothetical protein
MTGRYINISTEVVQTISLLSDLDEDKYVQVFDEALKALEGGLNKAGIKALAGYMGGKEATLMKIVQASSILLWDLVKGAPTDLKSISEALQSMGMKHALVSAFLGQYEANRQRLNNLKGALAISKRRYKDLEWRLDVEVARRQMTSMSAPKYQIRLDVYDPRGGNVGTGTEESFEFQSDYANLVHMEKELEKALDELATVHGQRMTGYIK